MYASKDNAFEKQFHFLKNLLHSRVRNEAVCTVYIKYARK